MRNKLNGVLSRNLLLLLFVFVGFMAKAEAQEFPERPQPARLVNDFADIFSMQQEQALNEKLAEFARAKTTQIAVVTVTDLMGYDKSEYSFLLAEKWGIGQKGTDNGILILVKPKTKGEKGKVFIAIGYGLEGVVPDIVAQQTIVNTEMLPYFRRGDMYTGVDRAAEVLMGLTAKEFTAEQYYNAAKKSKGKTFGGLGTILFFIVMFVVFGRGRSRFHSVGRGSSLLNTILLMNLMNNRHSGSWNDFSSGGGSFGGGGGFSDFGGFGGGSFGGGGAGGEW